MMYTLLFQDYTGRTFSSAKLEADEDSQAIERARRIYASGIGRGYEIWCAERLIHAEKNRAPNFGLHNLRAANGE